MDNAVNILLAGMPHDLVREGIFQLSIGREKADFFGNGMPNEAIESCGVGILDDSRDKLPLRITAPTTISLPVVPTASLIFLSACRFFVKSTGMALTWIGRTPIRIEAQGAMHG
jgi:hypothetical protein